MKDFVNKVAILTLGCRVNHSESSVIEGTLRNNGIPIVAFDEEPDICIINTCTVTGKSDARSRYLIRRALRSHARVIVTGCYSELRRDEISELQGDCEVISVEDKDRIISSVLGINADPVYFLHNCARPYLKVQDGCNFSCTYCAVPFARGRSRSLTIDEAVSRASDMSLHGYNEIVLTGIHLGSYGQDLYPMASLSQLIRTLLLRTSVYRIRLSSIEINEIDDELIELLGDARVCKHLHLPLQSGSDRILRLMNRNYTAQGYVKKLLGLSARYSDLSLGTDVIVGFPAEDNAEFIRTRDLIRELPFSYIHTFPYSARSGTAASAFEPKIERQIINERAKAVQEIGRTKQRAFLSAQSDRIHDAVAEADDYDGCTTGTTSNYVKIEIKGTRIKRGSVVFVRSVAAESGRLTGILIT